MRSILDRLEAATDALASVSAAGLPVDGLQELVARTSVLASRLTGIGSRAVGELQVRGGGQVPDPAVAGAACPLPAWLRSVAKVSGTEAGRQVRTSVALRELPAVAQAVVDGQISPEHGRVLTRLVGKIELGALLESQPQLIEVARRTDPDELAQYVRHLLATWCEPDLDAEEASAEDRRFLQLRNTHNGSWRGIFELPDADMEVLRTALEPLARRDGDSDTRPAGQRRADALTDIAGLALRHADLPDAGGHRPVLTYLVPATWTDLGAALQRLHADVLASIDPLALPAGLARALDDPALHGIVGAGGAGGTGGTGGFMVDLDGHPGRDCATGPWTGPATRARIDTLLCDARVQRVVLGEDGQVLSLSTTTDVITAAQRRAVAARDRCCTAKGCTRPPAFCDVHHLWAREDGGPTDIDNLVLLCRRHHVMWHRQLLTLTDLRVPWKRLPQPRAPDLA
ncbi:MAG: DUF222 domain-containing protein [Frankiaceae bacterium]|nr:DUF222 domain-containing protein [Frankiaceae bacterium]